MSSINDEITFVGNSGISDKGLPLRNKGASAIPAKQYPPQFNYNYSSNSKHPFESQPNKPKPVKVKQEIATSRRKRPMFVRVSRIYNKFFNRLLKRHVTRR